MRGKALAYTSISILEWRLQEFWAEVSFSREHFGGYLDFPEISSFSFCRDFKRFISFGGKSFEREMIIWGLA